MLASRDRADRDASAAGVAEMVAANLGRHEHGAVGNLGRHGCLARDRSDAIADEGEGSLVEHADGLEDARVHSSIRTASISSP